MTHRTQLSGAKVRTRQSEPNLGSAELALWRLHGDGAGRSSKEVSMDGWGERAKLCQSLAGRLATALGHEKVSKVGLHFVGFGLRWI